mmetsp:Transcript_33312/g.106298  ORF Transcript_33312/g.106298 Transcript_33312/m.106298 type:complete len:155 (-) Transcript_33312:374-838(-)
MKESAGKGDYHGTLGPKFRNMGQGGQKPKQKGDFPVGMPNIITNPLKKGSYGTIKTTLGEKQGVAGVTGEYSYAGDPYDAAKKKARALPASSWGDIGRTRGSAPPSPPPAIGCTRFPRCRRHRAHACSPVASATPASRMHQQKPTRIARAHTTA